MKTLLVLITTVFMFACTESAEVRMKAGEKLAKGQEVAFAALEESRAQGRSNNAFNAAVYQSQNPRLEGYDLVPKADSTHDSKCPQGDGWAETVFMKKMADGKFDRIIVMCSTVSASIGCVMVSPTNNWDKHPGKKQDGQCATTHEVPYPLPKLAGKR